MRVRVKGHTYGQTDRQIDRHRQTDIQRHAYIQKPTGRQTDMYTYRDSHLISIPYQSSHLYYILPFLLIQHFGSATLPSR